MRYDDIIDNHLISLDQSSFKQGDSSINQPLLIKHEIYNLFEKGLEIRGILLNISNAFVKA